MTQNLLRFTNLKMKDRNVGSVSSPVLPGNETHEREGPLCNTSTTHVRFNDVTISPYHATMGCGVGGLGTRLGLSSLPQCTQDSDAKAHE